MTILPFPTNPHRLVYSSQAEATLRQEANPSTPPDALSSIRGVASPVVANETGAGLPLADPAPAPVHHYLYSPWTVTHDNWWRA